MIEVTRTVKICGTEIWGVSKEAHRCETRFASTSALEESSNSRQGQQMRSWEAEEIVID